MISNGVFLSREKVDIIGNAFGMMAPWHVAMLAITKTSRRPRAPIILWVHARCAP
jgi:hypothetical protein